MRTAIEAVAKDNNIYRPRRKEFDTNKKVPFRVSPEPLFLPKEQKGELQNIGFDIASYFKLVDEMYMNDVEGVQKILDTGKPEIFLINQPSHYLFVRPDLVITPYGFSLCEIETSPFGLALAEILNRAYRNEGFETMVADDTLAAQIRTNTPIEGNIIYSKKTQAYSGQMTFLADEVFSGNGRDWKAEAVDSLEETKQHNIYRGFYLGEYLIDAHIKILLNSQINGRNKILPSPTPFMEEKAILSLIYDKRYQEYLRRKLGDASFRHLRAIIPPTWIVGQEQYFTLGMPNNISTSVDLANLSRSKRAFVLKASGFAENSSWKEGRLIAIKATGCENTDFIHATSTSINTSVA